jgi:hypothetical protein
VEDEPTNLKTMNEEEAHTSKDEVCSIDVSTKKDFRFFQPYIRNKSYWKGKCIVIIKSCKNLFYN